MAYHMVSIWYGRKASLCGAFVAKNSGSHGKAKVAFVHSNETAFVLWNGILAPKTAAALDQVTFQGFSRIASLVVGRESGQDDPTRSDPTRDI